HPVAGAAPWPTADKLRRPEMDRLHVSSARGDPIGRVESTIGAGWNRHVRRGGRSRTASRQLAWWMRGQDGARDESSRPAAPGSVSEMGRISEARVAWLG